MTQGKREGDRLHKGDVGEREAREVMREAICGQVSNKEGSEAIWEVAF